MATSGESARALAVSGHGDRSAAAAAVSGPVERSAAAVSSQGQRMLLDSLDYPCTERLRFRRLLAYLREHCCDQIYDVASARLGVIFHVEDLAKQVKAGKFREASGYVCTFAPLGVCSNDAELLVLFLDYLMAISGFADGDTVVAGIVCDWFKRLYRLKHPLLSKYPCFANIVANVLFLRTQNVRNSLDWQLVRNKAAEIVEEMAYKVPELKDAMHYPRGRNYLYDVMPIRSSFHPRRHVKNTGQKQPADLAQFYLQLKKRLPSSDQVECHDYSGSSRNKVEILIALLDKALQAGKRMVLNQVYPPEHLSKGVFPLEAALSYKSIPNRLREVGYRLEQTPNQAMKCSRFQESHRDTAKRPRTTQNFGEDQQ